MIDVIRETKFDKSRQEFHNYRKYMCAKCVFFKDEICTKKRIPRICAKKGLKNKD